MIYLIYMIYAYLSATGGEFSKFTAITHSLREAFKKKPFFVTNVPLGGGFGVGPCHKKTIASKSCLSNFKHF